MVEQDSTQESESSAHATPNHRAIFPLRSGPGCWVLTQGAERKTHSRGQNTALLLGRWNGCFVRGCLMHFHSRVGPRDVKSDKTPLENF